ncbi:putative D-alanyl-D-alanine carboxypeptidase VanY [Campylobacter pinnipediorum subsp. caledonicus]|uniref:Putative D-alanyl-D-alanine carboxypeptidase VanY n=1 Tax=Campylobacter pinnipediorum subsp. caledonicus TaxID=1874362 RepID=A0A1S6U619_9BACT|nr:M15 family metallopeptidase [Campylobacter pinnipediorum]AQW85547.1 putative D-alanyl-D-alanine carboxypeptidase VanY [Campylobacter pinnipediorum subsp. caledonicus]AQW87132.1 putative D-alanyl-D-alanine carboxypeptidase VanY [Campylobacter pinnipediorum subsp. caledonicus]OPA71830.1 L-alanyl-D-glutamate peptidase [Campylobacter pinnipediorum subsp. caledonicus]
MSLGKEQELFMKDVEKLLHYIHTNGYSVRGGELLRTKEQQEIYLKTGKSKTNNSNHLIKCAIDLFIFKEGNWLTNKDDLKEIGAFWESLTPINKWGGNYKNFTDCPHFERRVNG